jgi:hypothetical protein
MRAISIQRSVVHFLDHLEATEAALAAHPDTKALAAPFTEAIGEFEGIFSKERAARRAVTRAQAVLTVGDTLLDIDTTRFGGYALVEAGQDRANPSFRQLFPKAPSQLIRWNLRKQCEHTLHVIVPLLAKLDAASLLKPFAVVLEGRAQAVLTALDARTKAKAALSSVSVEVEEWKDGVNRLRLSTYAELLKVAAEKKYPRSFADAFFLSESRTTLDEEPLEPPAPVEPIEPVA